MAYYRITFAKSPSNGGYVTRNSSSTTAISYMDVAAGEHFTFYARPNAGYYFSY